MTVTRPNQFGKWPCPCCGYHTLPEAAGGTFHLCPVCGWEDDPVQFGDPDYRGGANEPSLREARRNFEMRGRCDNLEYPVRRPEASELPRFDWAQHGGRGGSGESSPEQTEPSRVYPVRLGRDAAVRPFKDLQGGRRYQCVCCGRFTLEYVDECDVCGHCGWEDWYECHESPLEVVRPNYISLSQAREALRRFGPGAVRRLNRARGLPPGELERLSPEQVRSFRTLDEEMGRGGL